MTENIAFLSQDVSAIKGALRAAQAVKIDASLFKSDMDMKGREFVPAVAQQQILLADAGQSNTGSYGQEDTNGEASGLVGLGCGISMVDLNPVSTAFICGGLSYIASESGVQLPESDFEPHAQSWDDTDYGNE